jgi:uncharacterized protein (DUF849 family)
MLVQIIFGILGGIGADIENLVHMRRIANKLFGEDLLAVEQIGRETRHLPVVESLVLSSSF